MYKELSLKGTGFIVSLMLTLAAYFMIVNPAFFDFDARSASIVIFILALTQSLVQLIFFIDIWKDRSGFLWNLGVFISTASIIFIVIYFSIWIINHLNYNMH
jgi:cytochrome o ubiquinol oxidase operon protein cyoD